MTKRSQRLPLEKIANFNHGILAVKLIKLILIVATCFKGQHIFSQDWGAKFKSVRDGVSSATPIRPRGALEGSASRHPFASPVKAFALDSSVSTVGIGLEGNKKSPDSVVAIPTVAAPASSSPVRAISPKIDREVVFTAEEEFAAAEEEARSDAAAAAADEEVTRYYSLKLILGDQRAAFISEYAICAVDLWHNDCKPEAKRAVASFAKAYPDDIPGLRFFLKQYQAKRPSVIE